MMRVLVKPLCRAVGHRPDRAAKWHDRINWRTHCARCRTPLIRILSDWREFDSDRHLNPRRAAHPEFDRPDYDRPDYEGERAR